MKLDKFNKRDTRFAPWTALCLLSLIAAMVFALPAVVSAQTYEFSQDCDTALVGKNHTVKVKITGRSPGEMFGYWFGTEGPNRDKIDCPAFYMPWGCGRKTFH